jgi:hypothetical protein
VSGWTDDIATWVEDLRQRRPVFHSEADFQHALAWSAHQSNPSLRVRLETRPAPGMRLDLLLSKPNIDEHLALELKYLTAAWAGVVENERFTLVNQAAQDIRAYDVVKDVKRVEQFVSQPHWSGAVLVLTNDPGYWSRPSHGRATNADAFRIYEGQRINGRRSWGPNNTGAGTMKGRHTAIEVHGDYTCGWSDYSSLPGPRGRFRLLTIPVASQSK